MKNLDPDQKVEFGAAIKEASNAGIILFNSLRDKEMTNRDDWLPLYHNEVIRIGSATRWGDKDERSKKGLSNYLFPGKDIPLTRGPELVSGSSLATAFAAGLAALIIYTTRVLPLLDVDLSVEAKAKLKSVTSREEIERIFKLLGGTQATGDASDLYVNPGEYFPSDPQADRAEKGDVELLKDFLKRLRVL
jgi:hypothetical protein